MLPYPCRMQSCACIEKVSFNIEYHCFSFLLCFSRTVARLCEEHHAASISADTSTFFLLSENAWSISSMGRLWAREGLEAVGGVNIGVDKADADPPLAEDTSKHLVTTSEICRISSIRTIAWKRQLARDPSSEQVHLSLGPMLSRDRDDSEKDGLIHR